MKYQGLITERPDLSLLLKAEYHAYYVPVKFHEGGWFAAGPARLDPIDDQVELLSNVLTYQLFQNRDECGPLDDLVSPDGHTVVARYWMEDDYEPPTPAQKEERQQQVIGYLKSIGVWRDRPS
jgi:hypothetical protein